MELGGLYKKIIKNNVPFYMAIEVTTSCNQNCLHCYNIRDKKHEISFSQIRRILKEASSLGALFLSITGGEPMQREDIWDILDYAVKQNFATLLYTNGTLIGPSEAQKLKSIGVYWVDITILGASSETHDRITGLPGSYDLSMRAIELLREKEVGVAVKTPALRENFAELHKIKKKMSSMGLMHIVSPVVYPKDSGDEEPLRHRLTDEQMKDYFRFHEPATRVNPLGEFSCDLGRVMLAISAKGDVYPCLCVPYNVGNISKNSLSSLWKDSVGLKYIREGSQVPCESFKKCDDMWWCFRCEGLAWLEKGEMFVADSESCRMARIRREVDLERERKKGRG